MPQANLVLLFYDGFERQAATSLPGQLKACARRHARFLWRTLHRKQVRTGYYTAFMNLCLALRRAGIDYRINDFAAARRYPEHPIAVCGYPTVFEKIADLPNPRLIGPGIYTSPSENPTLFKDPRSRFYIQRCEWMKNLFAPYYGEENLLEWFRGFDVSDFEDAANLPKKYDVLIYDKIYHNRDANLPRTVEPFVKRLEEQGLTYKVFKYGSYIRQDYMQALRASRSLAFFCHSETQGHAYQEAMAMNLPIFAWDEGVWLDPLAQEVSPDKPIPATSVPHFDDRCGVRFQVANMLEDWDRFWPAHAQFTPRAFVAETLTLKRSAELYLEAYRAAGAARVSKVVGDGTRGRWFSPEACRPIWGVIDPPTMRQE